MDIAQQIYELSLPSLYDETQEQVTYRSEAFYRARLHLLKKLYAKRQREKAEALAALCKT